MRVAYWAKFYPPEWGGMERVARDLAVGVAARGARVTVVAYTHDRQAVGASEGDGVTVVRALARWRMASQPLSLAYVAACLRAGAAADVVHIHVPNPLAVLPLVALRLRFAFARRRPKVVVQWHSDIIGKGLAGWLVAPFEWLMLVLADAIAPTSPAYMQGSAMLRRFAGKCRVVPLGIAPPEPCDAPLPAAIAGFARGRGVVLGVGRLVGYKGFGVLIEAAARLDAGLAVVIVGTGPLEGALRARIAALGLEDRVMLAGALPQAGLEALFAGAALYAMASVERSEAFGVVLLEAMAHRLAVVASDIAGSGVPWVVGPVDAAQLVPPGDADALAAALNALAADPKRAARIARLGAARFAECFTLAAMVENFEALYSEVCLGAG